jgi:hypothetical protein
MKFQAVVRECDGAYQLKTYRILALGAFRETLISEQSYFVWKAVSLVEYAINSTVRDVSSVPKVSRSDIILREDFTRNNGDFLARIHLITPTVMRDISVMAHVIVSLSSGNCIQTDSMNRDDSSAIRKASSYCVRLIESYCVGCGLLIAASPRRQVLAIMEKLHECPVYFHYGQPEKRAS